MSEQAGVLAGVRARPEAAGDARAWTTRLGFTLGAFGPSLGFQLVIVLMLRFMTDSLAMSAVVAGGLMAATRLFDAIIDPLIGVASDKTRTPIGRRRPYFIAAAILLPLSSLLMFNAPALAGAALTGFVGLMLFLNGAGYSAFTVPYIAAASEITDDYHERSTLMAFRVYGQTFGLMAASTGAPWLLALWGAGRAAHGAMAWTMAPLILASLAAAAVLIPEPRYVAREEPKAPLSRRIATALGNRPFAMIILSHVGFQIGVGAVLVTTAYFTRQVLHVSDVWLGWFYLSKTLANLVSVPFWLWIARRFDKRWSYVASLIVYGLLNLSWLAAGAHEPMAVMFTRNFAIGFAMGGCILLAASVITDAIRYDTVRTGLRREGVFSGVVSFVDKTFQGVGVAVVGALLTGMGYVSSLHGQHIHQPSSAITAIYIGFSVIPAAAALVCVLAMLGYTLKAEDFAAKT